MLGDEDACTGSDWCGCYDCRRDRAADAALDAELAQERAAEADYLHQQALITEPEDF